VPSTRIASVITDPLKPQFDVHDQTTASATSIGCWRSRAREGNKIELWEPSI
jgi:hypothetical protein